MYSPAVQALAVLLLAAVAALVVLISLPPLITGMVCGIKMQGLTVRRGLRLGLWTAAGAAVITIEGMLLIGANWWSTTTLTGFPVLVGSILLTIWLCRRESRRNLGGSVPGATP